MRRCSSECYPLCDFCHFFAFNGQPVKGLDGRIAMVYVGEGRCEHPDHSHPEDPESYCEDFYCENQAKEDDRELRRLSDFNVLTSELAVLWDAGDLLMHCDVPPEMRVSDAYSGAIFADETPENLRGDAHGSLRHSRAHTRAQRRRWIAKRMGYFQHHSAPPGLLAKWNGGANVRARRAKRIRRAKTSLKFKPPRYPLNEDVA